MRAGRRGDAQAYRRALSGIADAVRPRVRQRLGRAAEETEDVVQTVLLTIHLKNASWDERLPVLPWAYAIADHKAIDALRRRRRASRLIAEDVTAEDVAGTVAAPDRGGGTAGLDVERLLGSLSSRERQVVRALALDGGTIASAATAFGMREGAVRVAFHRALKRLARAARGEFEPGASPGRKGGAA